MRVCMRQFLFYYLGLFFGARCDGQKGIGLRCPAKLAEPEGSDKRRRGLFLASDGLYKGFMRDAPIVK
jgi:hypothetical protein